MKSHEPIAVLFDVDGTLIDSNDAHASAWVAAFAEHGIDIEFAHIRRCIGMGGDKLMPEVSSVEEGSDEGTAIAKRRGEIFSERFLPHLKPFRDAGALVAELKARGHTVVAASSAKREELQPLLAVAGADALMDASTYDVEAASRAGVRIIAFRCGGWADEDLKGALAIYDGPWDLLFKIGDSPLGECPSTGSHSPAFSLLRSWHDSRKRGRSEGCSSSEHGQPGRTRPYPELQ